MLPERLFIPKKGPYVDPLLVIKFDHSIAVRKAHDKRKWIAKIFAIILNIYICRSKDFF